jgi:hypothetical protein
MHVTREDHSERLGLYLKAMEHFQAAIDLLDRANAPGHIAAHLDLAMHKLQDVIENEQAGGRLVQIERNAAPQ